jgi:putative N-acetylmannosamine-6-phosphate epimerase
MFDTPVKVKNFAALEEEVLLLRERVVELEKIVARMADNEEESNAVALRLGKVADLLEAQTMEIARQMRRAP